MALFRVRITANKNYYLVIHVCNRYLNPSFASIFLSVYLFIPFSSHKLGHGFIIKWFTVQLEEIQGYEIIKLPIKLNRSTVHYIEYESYSTAQSVRCCVGYMDVGDGCWRRNQLVTTFRCWWPSMSPRYRCWHQHEKKSHQHQSVKLRRKSVTNIMSPT